MDTLSVVGLSCGILIIGILAGAFLITIVEANHMEQYDLYNCIYNNADLNNFNNNPIMIKKIQNECICFSEHNYTNLLEANC
jgi:hypothetical protein